MHERVVERNASNSNSNASSSRVDAK